MSGPASRSRSLGRLLAAWLGLVLATASSSAVLAADPSFGAPVASAAYGKTVTFEQPLVLSAAIVRAEILIDFPGDIGPLVEEVDPPACCGSVTLRHVLSMTTDHLVPNTRLAARWRLRTADGATLVGPSVALTYADTRFDWRTKAGRIVRVHWYQGSDAFGDRALAIGEQAVEDAAKLLGVTETDPVDFYVYADKAAFYDALGPGTRENVGGEAHADIRTMFALITPDQIDASWVATVVPHELTHLVFDTAVKNPYHFPPRWLNEGLAVYLSEGYGDSWRSAVRDAVSAGSIIPLDGLTAQFPTTSERFYLAYGESVSAVDFVVRTFGRPALVALIRSYASGVTDDEAFKAALGVDVAGFEARWYADLGIAAPAAHGPGVVAYGPLPNGWTTGPAEAAASPAPSGAASPGAASPGPSTGSGTGSGPNGGLPLLALAVGAVVLALLGGLLVRRARRREGSR